MLQEITKDEMMEVNGGAGVVNAILSGVMWDLVKSGVVAMKDVLETTPYTKIVERQGIRYKIHYDGAGGATVEYLGK